MGWLRFFKKTSTPTQTPQALSKRELGTLGEKLAGDFLKKRHYHILETNYRCSTLGEIDIIATHKKELVFVEVRTKTSLSYGLPEESITTAKKKKLVSLAFHYLQTHKGLPSSWRIDVVAVELDKGGKVKRIEIIENAVS